MSKSTILDASFIDTSSALPANPVTEMARRRATKASKTRRATPEEKANYYKQATFWLTRDQYTRYRALLAREERIGQELLVELLEKWMNSVDRKQAKALEGSSTDVSGNSQ